MKIRVNQPTKLISHGFTLIEMLVVLLIMATLIGVGANVMKNASKAQGTDTGIAMAEGVFSEARALAKSSEYGARVVIYNGGAGNKESQAKHLRYMGVVRILDDNGTADPFDDTPADNLISAGTLLPSNVYFNENLSGLPQTMQVLIPGFSQKQECFYYQFNSEGFLVEPSKTNPADTESPTGNFILQLGTLFPGDPIPRKAAGDDADVAGFAIWKRGNVSRYQTNQQIEDEIGKALDF